MIGIGIWILGIIAFSLSFLINVLDNLDLQSNIALSIALIPIVIFGTKFYYKKDAKANPFLVGLVLLATVIVLDALFTVPFIVMPSRVSYADFFLTPSFWLIALEFYGITVITGKTISKS